MLSLGLEFSTQSLKILLLNIQNGGTEYAFSADYDSAFPHYGTEGGVLPSSDRRKRHAPALMFVEALDYAFGKMSASGVPLSDVAAVKVNCMQHCTVYTNSLFTAALPQAGTGGAKTLAELFNKTISRASSPIWEDRTTETEAALLTRGLADRGTVEGLTCNRAELRFPAAQILKWGSECPAEYDDTAGIYLLSAFITSILAGRRAPVDTGDGWGSNMNNSDIINPGWDETVVRFMDSCIRSRGALTPLREKLGSMCPCDYITGFPSRYFTEKYGLNEHAVVLAGTGDNPATLLGCGGGAVLSLGSSYTVNGVVEEIIPPQSGEYNIFGWAEGRAMALSVITNGAKVHDFFLERYAGVSGKSGSWENYSVMSGPLLLSRDEKIMLPYLFDESVPLRPGGIIRQGFSEDDPEINVRALHLSQALALKLHSGHLKPFTRLCVAGGASKNVRLLQWIADAFGAELYRIIEADYAAVFGCAVSGARCVLNCSCEEAVERYVRADSAQIIRPVRENEMIIRQVLAERYRELEKINI